MSAMQVNAFEIITISAAEASQYDLVFPDQSLLFKIPAYLMPEEIAPPLHWMQMSELTVCVLLKSTKDFIELNRDTTGRLEFHPFLNSDFVHVA